MSGARDAFTWAVGRGAAEDGRAARALPRFVPLVLAAVLLQVLLLSSGFRVNPYVQVPTLDSAHFWAWGGRIADGTWVQDHPYFGAPLFPHLVALVRGLGGGLVALAVVQAGLHVATVFLVARAAGRLLGERGGWVAGAAYLLLSEPALATGRVLGCTLQLFLLALLLERCAAFDGRTRAALVIGLVTGLLALAWPAFILAVPVLAAWCLATAGRAQGLACLAASVAGILPATAHNVAASGEAIPISAHGGITFWHGNNPEAEGVFAAVGVINDKDLYHLDALEQTRAALGPEAGWSDASSYFFGKGLDWWVSEPLHAAGVALRKARYLMTGTRYGDVYVTSLEERDGLLSPVASWLASTAVLMPLTVLVLLLLVLRRPVQHAPLIIAGLLPLVVCVGFWYTPRYRMPITPVAALFTAFALIELARGGARPALRAGLVLALVVGFAGPLLNRATGFDRTTGIEAGFLTKTGSLLGQLGEHDRALDFYVRATAANPDDAVTRNTAYQLLRHAGREGEAVELLEAAPPETRADPAFQVFLAYSLATTPAADARDAARALRIAEGAQRSGFDSPATWEAIAVARAAGGDLEGALTAVRGARASLDAADPMRARFDELERRFASGEAWVEPPLPPL